MPRQPGHEGGVNVDVETCGCGCGSMTVGDSEAHNTCGCGCGTQTVAARTPEQEIAELRALRESIDRRLEELAS